MTLKVGVLGALGKVGREVCTAVEGAEDLELVARVDADDELQRAASTRARRRSSTSPTPTW